MFLDEDDAFAFELLTNEPANVTYFIVADDGQNLSTDDGQFLEE
jgi:hypothetical protein